MTPLRFLSILLGAVVGFLIFYYASVGLGLLKAAMDRADEARCKSIWGPEFRPELRDRTCTIVVPGSPGRVPASTYRSL